MARDGRLEVTEEVGRCSQEKRKNLWAGIAQSVKHVHILDFPDNLGGGLAPGAHFMSERSPGALGGQTGLLPCS